MNASLEKTLLHLTGKTSFSEVTVEQLEAITNAHPYFAPAQLLLAVKLKDIQHAEANAQSTRTALYFTNPFWLHYQLRREKAEGQPDKTAPGVSKISSLLSDHLAGFKKPLEADAQLEIETAKEKLYTIDYFASQGIKIDLDAIPQDKLVTQMRKFTDWLKQMKPADTNADLGLASNQEKAVIKIAETSNEPREIVTESMAEVLEKQGQIEKAIQLYIKLSFLNPEKTAYFAARIQQLKGI
jgi:tetratricopeptide (TPR) repeat protein